MTLKQLAERLNYHREFYYNGTVLNPPAWLVGEEPISDDEYDDLCSEIAAIDPNHPSLQEVGNVTGGDVKHENRMGSLAKVKKIEDLKEWYKKYALTSNKIWIMPKYDGASLGIRYDKIMKLAATRGNGNVGCDVTANTKVIKNVPSKIIGKKEIRGEALMAISVFNRLNSLGQDLKNVRNAASGSLKQEDPTISAQRDLSFVAYDLIDDVERDTYAQVLEDLTGLGFDIGYSARSFVIKNGDFSEVEAYLQKFQEDRKNKKFDYAMDGVVVALDSLKDQHKAGWSNNGHHPNGKIAFKFDPEKKQTKVLGYTLQVGKTGRLTPVGNLEPVDLDGSEVSNATFHNFGTIIQYGLFAGAVVNVVKANDVIPYVQYKKVITPVFETFGAGNYYPKCPCCGSATVFDGVNLWCENEDCEARLSAKILHFFRITETLRIGEVTVQKLISDGLVTRLQDLFDEHRMTIPNIAKALGSSKLDSREAEVVFDALATVRNLPFNVFIEALGISKVGTNTSKKLASYYKTPENMLDTVNYDTIVNFDDIGPVTAKSIITSLEKRQEEIVFLAYKIGIVLKVATGNSLDGKSFLFTGTLSKPRKHFEDIVESNGGKLSGSVNKKLNYLIVGEDSGSKLTKAQAMGVPCLTEEEFLAML